MGLIKDLFLKVACKCKWHVQTEILYSVQPKKVHNKGVESKKYHFDVYGIKRCLNCKKDIKERLLKESLTENQVIQYVDLNH